MAGYKTALGLLTIAIALVSYSFYFHDIFSGKTKPQPFSWFVWSLLSGIAFTAQLVEHAGPGAWITGFTAVICFVISVIASFKSSERFKLFDWLSLFAAIFAILIWRSSDDPKAAVVIVTWAYVLGFLPTFRKAYIKPREETAITFALNGTKYAISIAALNSLSVSTWLYPAALAAINSAFALMLYARRKATK